MDFEKICASLRNASATLATHTAQQKNHALECVAASIEKSRTEILSANERDVEKARAGGMAESLVERLALSDKKIDDMISGLRTVINQADPIGETLAGWNTPNGMSIRQVRVPLGVVAIIYESRPNVTADAFCLAYKSGNSIFLRGSSSALESNRAIVAAIKDGLKTAGDDGVADALELSESTSHDDVQQILAAVGKIDVVLPRGGARLIKTVVENAKIPVIETGSGVCHLYVDESADLQMAARIAENAKIQRPGACNAIETILVHKNVAQEFLPLLVKQLDGRVELRADEFCLPILQGAACESGAASTGERNATGASCETAASESITKVVPAAEADYGYEFLDFICTVHVVSDIAEAVTYINSHNTKHSECIVTNNRSHARLFQEQIDAACVYVNSSTRFTDGGEFGFGMELGISTQKLHARGPMGLQALTTTKYLIDGDGQIR